MELDPFTVYSITATACTIDGCDNQTNPLLRTTAKEGYVLEYNINTVQ